MIVLGVLLLGAKSTEEEQMGSDASADVTTLMNNVRSQMSRANELMTHLNTAIAEHDSIVATKPKATPPRTTADLTSANDQLSLVNAQVDAWIKVYQPYNEDADLKS